MLTLADLPLWLCRVFALLWGLLWGSFLNVVIYRVPRGLSVVRPGSHCPVCNTPIKVYENIPVLGWVFLRGKARCCGARISIRYPLVEAMAGLLSWALLEVVILRLTPDTPLPRALAIFCADVALCLSLVAAAFIDLEEMYIPDSITFSGTLTGILTTSFRPPLTYLETGLGALGGFLIVWLPFDVLYRLIRKKTGMAMGDAKLVMMAGAWFGFQGAIFSLVAGAIQGTLAAIAILLFQGQIQEPEGVRKQKEALLQELAALPPEERDALQKEIDQDPIFQETGTGLGARIAFGPFVALAMLEYLLIGNDLLEGGWHWLTSV